MESLEQSIKEIDEEGEKNHRSFYDEGRNIKIDIIGTQRGGHKLHAEGYLYTNESKAGQRIHWRCIKRKECKGRMTTLVDYHETPIGIMKNEHSHEGDPM